jgi:hypothetical protein
LLGAVKRRTPRATRNRHRTHARRLAYLNTIATGRSVALVSVIVKI